MNKTIEASLNEDYTHPVRDVMWGHVYMTEKQAHLAESPHFLRLNRIMQLGPVYLVYPGATHTRASHSIGVYHLGRRLLQNLAERGASKWLSPEGVKSFLAACLLHDLGHFPYTHSLKELSLSSHESLTGELILKDPIKSLVAKTGADPDLTAAIVDKEKKNKSDELFFFRKLLSGALDPDKLDYLNRDARYCGVPYGAQDVDFILSRLNPNKERGVDIDSRLIPNVESILFSKYLMYRTVYWHKQVRAATAMVKKALINGLETGKLKGEDLYNLDDMSLFALLGEKTGGNLVESVREGRIFTTAAEISPENANLACIRSIDRRAQFEERLAQELRRIGIEITGEDIIIDIPEPVSFETGLFVTDENCSFGSSSSAFKEETVNAFVNTLYTIRVYINQKYKETIKTNPKVCSTMEEAINRGI
ncbi:MAG: HD domain-containing protein [Treponema sp.]|nr:HD domain-containing protein [Treponema sp.]MCL2237635.1 HD domain-containing protein [Treponema sp.]